jgi:negative regulator of flagellin synthesis FlgM
MMKIGNPADKTAGTAPVATTRTQPGEAAKAQEVAAQTTDPSAKVELSNTAATLMSTDASSDFDAEKVARIAQAISDGKFQIDADKIADRLIANAHDVLGKAQH